MDTTHEKETPTIVNIPASSPFFDYLANAAKEGVEVGLTIPQACHWLSIMMRTSQHDQEDPLDARV